MARFGQPLRIFVLTPAASRAAAANVDVKRHETTRGVVLTASRFATAW
jgi:hypothetical protein